MPQPQPQPHHLDIAADLIEDFSLAEDQFFEASRELLAELGIEVEGEIDGDHDGAIDLTIFVRGSSAGDTADTEQEYAHGWFENVRRRYREHRTDLHITLRGRGTDNRLYLNPGITGDLTLGMAGSNSVVYVGRDCFFARQHIGSRQKDDFIAVGNDVSVTGPGRWVSGLRSGAGRPALIIGDACVLASDVVLRNSDGHPIMAIEPSGDQLALAEPAQQQNAPQASVVIEPHCWIGERAAVLKDVTVGAFSIIGFGAVVTSSVPRHHRALGNPATLSPSTTSVWCWDDSPAGIARAERYLARYPLTAS